MRFLVDNQLPGALALYLQKRGFDCEHVSDVGLASATDIEICNYALAQERIIISKDEDFLYLASKTDPPIRFLWVRLGNCRTSVLLAAFERLWLRIEIALNAGDHTVEIR